MMNFDTWWLTLAILGIHERVSSLSMKQDRLLCAAPFRLNIPPTYDKYLEWGFSDGSVRFYSSDSKKVRFRLVCSMTKHS